MNDKFLKRTKIVATVGPAIDNENKIKELINAGVNVFRLNTSHGNMEYHREKFNLIRKVSQKIGEYVAIMVDLQGPKIRVGNIEKEIFLQEGKQIVFSPVKGEEGTIPVDYDGIANDVQKGDKILIDDGKISVIVDKTEDNKVYVTVLNGGILKPRKGINIPSSASSLDSVTPKDVEFIKFAVDMKADYIALSFVREKNDVLLAKKYINDFGSSIPLIAKLEKPQAIENLSEIVSVSDCIMIARGDLGIELSPVEVPICQKIIIDECNKQKKPVIVATQMLESMIGAPIPTRAEASDVANAILDGADAVMLSGETSIGEYALDAVKTMADIAKQAETSSFYKFDRDFEVSEDMALTRQAIVFGADKMLKYVNAKAVLSFSHFGYSTRLVSKLKPSVPVIMVSDLEETCRKMTLMWGIFPYLKKWDNESGDDLFIKIDEFLINEIGLKMGDYVIIIGSSLNLITGRTNFVRVHKIGT